MNGPLEYAFDAAELLEDARREAAANGWGDPSLANQLAAGQLAATLALTLGIAPDEGEPAPGYVYVASSWRNTLQPHIINALRNAEIDCYNFRDPLGDGTPGFAWSDIDDDWQNWTAYQYIAALQRPIAEEGFRRDFEALQRADACVLVLPCGRSAHLELGWAVGAGKRTAILTGDGEEPELMAKMVDKITPTTAGLITWLRGTE